MRLRGQKARVDRAYLFQGCSDCGPRDEISLAAFYLHAIFLHGAKMRPACKQGHIESGLRHARAEMGADGSGSSDQEFHCWLSTSAEATARRRIFPVAVVGILSTKYSFAGHLYSARNSRQCLISCASVAPLRSCKTTAA